MLILIISVDRQQIYIGFCKLVNMGMGPYQSFGTFLRIYQLHQFKTFLTDFFSTSPTKKLTKSES